MFGVLALQGPEEGHLFLRQVQSTECHTGSDIHEWQIDWKVRRMGKFQCGNPGGPVLIPMGSFLIHLVRISHTVVILGIGTVYAYEYGSE